MKQTGGLRFSVALLVAGLMFGCLSSMAAPKPANIGLGQAAATFFETHCLDCHDGETKKGGLDLDALSQELGDRETFHTWVKLYDKVQAGEMPPPRKPRPSDEDLSRFLPALSDSIISADQNRVMREGRARVRRLNRFEYENCLREGLSAPWLQVADRLPEDGTAHLFNKVGEQLDVSHVQMAKYLDTAEHALRMAVQAAAHPTTTNRFYAREEPSMKHYLRWRPGLQTSATRATIPLIGTTPDPDVIRGKKPLTVGSDDPEIREQEAMGVVCGTYAATTKYDFTRMNIRVDGTYRIRMKTYTFLAGPNGASGGKDHGLTGGGKAWWRPSRTVAFPGTRSEPITLYALADSGDSRWLTTFDSFPEPRVIEREVSLKEGEKIRPDATRLVRTRPGWRGNPNATTNGVPGFAMNWLELVGPLHDQWPPASYQALFDELPFQVDEAGDVRVHVVREKREARRLLLRFMKRMVRRPELVNRDVKPFLGIYEKARGLGGDFTDAMITAYSAVLCSSDFLYLDSSPGALGRTVLASRLALFLWNGPPDLELLEEKDLSKPKVLRRHTERLLNDPRSERFVNAFLDYWLDLREINANAPDAELYPDYYLDDWLTESSLLETRAFIRELVAKDLPVRNLIDTDYAWVNERLAHHYGLPAFEGVNLRRKPLGNAKGRGGLLTQASVLRVTANGTTTSPVLRGKWVMERILGVEIPPPPSGVEAIEPDTRGAVTIREQLDKHRAIQSCASCHTKFDPAGFALESFDVAGGWRDRYRAVGEVGARVEGIGKNGHLFRFRAAQPVDCSGELPDGSKFKDISEFKKLLLKNERAIARNLVNRLVVYSTGAPVSFGERAAVETILDQCAGSEFGVRSLIHSVIQSELFLVK